MSKNPFILNTCADVVIIDGSVPKDILKRIERLNIRVIPTIPCQEVACPISYHPDIVLHPVNHSTLVVAPNVFEYYSDALSKKGIKLQRGKGITKRRMTLHNVGRIGDLALHTLNTQMKTALLFKKGKSTVCKHKPRLLKMFYGSYMKTLL